MVARGRYYTWTTEIAMPVEVRVAEPSRSRRTALGAPAERTTD
jgi:hypothetical protein